MFNSKKKKSYNSIYFTKLIKTSLIIIIGANFLNPQDNWARPRFGPCQEEAHLKFWAIRKIMWLGEEQKAKPSPTRELERQRMRKWDKDLKQRLSFPSFPQPFTPNFCIFSSILSFFSIFRGTLSASVFIYFHNLN